MYEYQCKECEVIQLEPGIIPKKKCSNCGMLMEVEEEL